MSVCKLTCLGSILLQRLHRRQPCHYRASTGSRSSSMSNRCQISSSATKQAVKSYSGMQGIRGAVPQDLVAIQALLLPLEEKGILAPRSDAQLLSDLRFFRVAERDANVSTRPTAEVKPDWAYSVLAWVLCNDMTAGTLSAACFSRELCVEPAVIKQCQSNCQDLCSLSSKLYSINCVFCPCPDGCS